MRVFKLLLPVVLLVVCVSVLQADTIHVPADSATIQAGINGAVDGDTVLVADGVYTEFGNRDIDFNGKAIMVMSENGAENCIVDCEGDSLNDHRGFYFHSGEDPTSVVKGFTIQNGYKDYGGGIYCNMSSPTIIDNTIIGCSSQDNGGGIYCSNNSSPTILNNTVMGNSAGANGGGIYHWYSSPIIIRNLITGNITLSSGGGIGCNSSSATIIDNTITKNSANGDSLYGNGGGIYCAQSSDATITNNTIYGNSANMKGGGIHCLGDSDLIVINSIFLDNNAPTGSEIYVSSYGGSSELTISYSDVGGGQASVYVEPGSYINPGSGNIDEDPLFVDPDNDDYHLQVGSPCIDAGDPDMPCKPWGGWRLDMGAYEYDQGFYWDGQNLIYKQFPIELPFSR